MGTPEGRILIWHDGFNANISLLFQAIENLSDHSICLLFGLLCKLLGVFWVYLGRYSFSQRISIDIVVHSANRTNCTTNIPASLHMYFIIANDWPRTLLSGVMINGTCPNGDRPARKKAQ